MEDSSIEQICVCLQKPSGNMYIFNSYIPPQSSFAVYKAHMDNISYIKCGLSLSKIIWGIDRSFLILAPTDFIMGGMIYIPKTMYSIYRFLEKSRWFQNTEKILVTCKIRLLDFQGYV